MPCAKAHVHARTYAPKFVLVGLTPSYLGSGLKVVASHKCVKADGRTLHVIKHGLKLSYQSCHGLSYYSLLTGSGSTQANWGKVLRQVPARD